MDYLNKIKNHWFEHRIEIILVSGLSIITVVLFVTGYSQDGV